MIFKIMSHVSGLCRNIVIILFTLITEFCFNLAVMSFSNSCQAINNGYVKNHLKYSLNITIYYFGIA